MKRMMLVVGMLSGCASVSDIQKTGQDTYTVAASASHGRGGLPAAKQIAYAAANKQCDEQSRQISEVKETSTRPSWTDGMYTVDLAFRCIAK